MPRRDFSGGFGSPNRLDPEFRWTKVDPAKAGELLRVSFDDQMRESDRPYSVQNVLLAQLDFDLDARRKGQWSVSAYTDRMPHGELRKIVDKHGGRGDSLDFVRSASKDRIRAFVEDVCRTDWMGGHSGLIGFRIMRHTNVSSGYPLWTIEAHGDSSHGGKGA